MKFKTIIPLLALGFIFLGLPVWLLNYEAHRSGQSLGEYTRRIIQKWIPQADYHKDQSVWTQTDFLKQEPIGEPIGDTKPWITNLTVVDLDQDGLQDVVLCDANHHHIAWIRQEHKGVFREKKIGDPIRGPAHVTPCDLDQDGDLDLLVAKMGMIIPSNDRLGAVVVLENNGYQNFINQTLVDQIARVTDVQPGDFDADGDIDLAVAQFGYDDGEIRWMENKGDWVFTSHNLLNLSGTIHTPVADMDLDGDLDIVALVSQEWEEIYVFENNGRGVFKTRMIYGSTNQDFGSSGISLTDLDQDGDMDILYTNGDAFDHIPPAPKPWHGLQWLENQGDLHFVFHRIANFAGAYSAQAVDIDFDGDLDLFAVSGFSDWQDPEAQSMAWFENRQMQFIPHKLANAPTHLLTLAAADMDADGDIDFVTGGLHAYPPFDRMSRVVLWKNERSR